MASQRDRNKLAAKVGPLLPGQTVTTAVNGRGNARLGTAAIVSMSIFAVIFIGGLLLGRILFPGGILLIVFFQGVRPPRTLAVTNLGATMFGRSLFSGRPTAAIGSMPLELARQQLAIGRTLDFGTEKVTFSGKEHKHLSEVFALPR